MWPLVADWKYFQRWHLPSCEHNTFSLEERPHKHGIAGMHESQSPPSQIQEPYPSDRCPAWGTHASGPSCSAPSPSPNMF